MLEVVQPKFCLTTGCGKEASLKCPKCVELGMDDSVFCNQECFKSFWKEHKKLHDARIMILQPGEISWPGFEYTGPLRAYKQTPQRRISASNTKIQRPDYADEDDGRCYSEEQAARIVNVKILNDEEQQGLRVACKLGREVLNEAYNAVAVGVTTDQIDTVVHEACIERDCYPSPLNYRGFPKSCCTSVNEVVCHGIPDTRPLQDGDILNVDITVYHRGFHGDLNETFLVGKNVPDQDLKLIRTTKECLSRAIATVKPGVKFRDIGPVIQRHANASGFSVVRTYCGHGIHRLFHTHPNVPHYAKNKATGVMKAGNAFTIEPMINAGNWQDTKWPDNWTAVTVDGKRSAQFEHTLLVTDTGCDILTARNDDDRAWFEDQVKKLGYEK